MGKYTKTFPQTFAEFHRKYGDVDDIYLDGNKLRVPKRADIPPGAPSGITTGVFSNKADSEENNFECNESTSQDEQIDDSFIILCRTFTEKLKSIGRDDDFICLMKSVIIGRLPLTNIALHLLLDVGQLMRDGRGIGYNPVTKQFWLAIHILLKARGTRLFRGNISFESDETLSSMNFAVPSEKTMERQFQTFKHEVSKPGIIASMLDQFDHQNKLKRPAKICIDGKLGSDNSRRSNWPQIKMISVHWIK